MLKMQRISKSKQKINLTEMRQHLDNWKLLVKIIYSYINKKKKTKFETMLFIDLNLTFRYLKQKSVITYKI